VWCTVGRGFKSHAYTHSVQEGHHVFLNLETMKFYCLPDNYEIIDQSLEDIVVSLPFIQSIAFVTECNIVQHASYANHAVIVLLYIPGTYWNDLI